MKKLWLIVILVFFAGCATTEKQGRDREEVIGEISKRLPPPPAPAIALPEITAGDRPPELTVPKEGTRPAEKNGALAKKTAPEGVPEIKVPAETPAGYETWNSECLIYEAKWNFAVLGKALLACQEENTRYGCVYHLVGVTLPVGLMAKLGYGFNRVDSYVNKETFEPYYFYSYTKSGKDERIIETEFQTADKTFTWVLKKYRNGKMYETRNGKVAYKNNIYDSIGIFYIMRSADLEKQKHFQFPVGITKIWDLSVKVKARRHEEVSPFPKQELYVVEPLVKSDKTDEGLFTGNMTIWITVNNRRLPIMMFGKLAFGTARLTLLSSDKLKPGFVLDQKNIAMLLSSN